MLSEIRGPADLQRLSKSQMDDLATEIREFLIHKVAATGGHLGPNLGVVELTLALHRVFDSPHDPIIFDTGHQAYVHKMLTGRCADFDNLRKKGGLSGYPSRSESEHDWVESSHASTALSYADGLAKAFELSGHRNRHVVAVVGDGALTGGMCWEALNNIATSRRPVIIIVNDNGRSYAPTIGGFADHLAALRLQPAYERLLEEGRKAVRGVPLIGELCYQCMHGVKVGIKDALSPQVMFTDLGLKYVGPIDGHDEHAVEAALRHARGFNAPVIVHVVTRKGMGYGPAESDEAEQMHSTGVIDPQTGLATSVAAPGWTSVFSDELIKRAAKRRDVVAITAAMPGPTGLSAFRKRFPDRFFDVGIAEQHAMTSAAGLAMGGMHPVVAIYSTFLNRAFDQMMMDVALHGLPVTMVLDRAGVTGNDGASHNGVWDMSILGIVPGMRVAAPRDAARLREELGEALDVKDGPTAIRFPKGDVGEEIPAVERRAGVDVLAEPADGLTQDVLLVAVGAFASMALSVAERLRNQGIGVTVVDPRWVLPVPEVLGPLARAHKLVVTLEDHGVHGGIGSSVSASLRHREIDVPCRDVGMPQEFQAHASRSEVLAENGLTDQNVARQITGWVAALGSSVGESRSATGSTSRPLAETEAGDNPTRTSPRWFQFRGGRIGSRPMDAELERWKAAGQYFDYLGFDIFFRVEGTGPALLLIHGYPFNSWDWSLIWPTLVERFTVIAPDMLGMGFSAKPSAYEYSVPDHADMHEALLHHLGVGSCHVLAHDLGDSVGQELLARYEAGDNAYGSPIIESITWLNGGLFNESYTPRLVQRLLSRTPLGDLTSRFQGSPVSRRIMDRTLDEMFGPNTKPTPRMLEQFHQIMEFNDGARVTHKVGRFVTDRYRHRNRWVRAMRETSVPMRLIDGPIDPNSGRHMAERYLEVIPEPDVVMLADDIGHWPQIEAPDAVLEHFLAHADRVIAP